jgi:hypothetical protein
LIDFSNSDTTVCPVTRTLVKNDGATAAPLDGGLENLVTIDSNGFVSINESVYDGTAITVRVKGITEFGTAVYKDVTITNKCSA